MEYRKGSVLDLCVVLLLLLCVAGLLFRWQYLRSREGDDGTESIILTLESETIDPLAIESLSVGELMYQGSGEPLGQILSLSVNEVEAEVLSNGVYYVGVWDRERLCRLRVTVLCEGSILDHGGIRVAGILLSTGESVQLFTSRAALCYRVQEITRRLS